MQRRLNNTQIENAGVDAVSIYFNFSETLDPNIPKRDKDPVWDGKLYLYHKGDKESKTNLIGIIPTQVKGREFRDFSNSKIKYQIKVNDISIYQRNNGIAFFVVYVNPDTQGTKIYYSLLAPIELRKLVSKAGKKKTISHTFEELPSLSSKVEAIFHDFYFDCLRQQSFSNQKPIQLNDIRDEIQSVDIQFSAPSGSEYEALKYLSKTPQFCYVTLKNDPTCTPHPLGDGRYHFKAEKKFAIPVRIGEKVFFDKVDCEFVNGESFLVIADCIRLPFTNTPKGISISHKTNIPFNFKTLSQRIKCLYFLKAVRDNGAFYIGDAIVQVDKFTSSDSNYIDSMLKTDLALQSVFDELHVSDDLVLTNISEQDIKNIGILLCQFVSKEPTNSIKSYENQLVRLDINNIKLLFLPSRIGDTNNYRLISVHDLNNFVIASFDSKHQLIRLPGFCIFSPESFKEVSNISYEEFLSECNKKESDDKNYYEVINRTILRMIKAYDLQENKKQVLIETALSLNQWLIENDPDNDLRLIHELNKLQILKRIQGLSAKEKEFLYDTIDANNSNEEVKFVCHTLLENKEAATRCFRKLPLEVQRFNETLPIFNLFSTLC